MNDEFVLVKGRITMYKNFELYQIMINLMITTFIYEPITIWIKVPNLYGTNLGIFFGENWGERWARQDLNLQPAAWRITALFLLGYKINLFN